MARVAASALEVRALQWQLVEEVVMVERRTRAMKVAALRARGCTSESDSGANLVGTLSRTQQSETNPPDREVRRRASKAAGLGLRGEGHTRKVENGRRASLLVAAAACLAGCADARQDRLAGASEHEVYANIQLTADVPNWVQIEQPGEALSFELYRSSIPLPADRPDLNCTSSYNCEVSSSPVDPHRPPVAFEWQPSGPIAPETAAGGCPVTDQPDQGVYYYDPASGAKLGSTWPPHYPAPSPAMFTISQPYSSVRGFTVNAFTYGSAESSPQGASALAVAYVTSNRCSSGNVEYGYFKDLTVAGQPVFAYYSDKTNCDGQGACRSADSFSSPPVYQVTSPLTKFANIRNYDGNDRDIFYSAYFVPVEHSPSVASSPTGYVLRFTLVDAVHTDRFATCTINDDPTPRECAVDVAVDSWYPLQKMMTGSSYVVTGTATSYPVAPSFAAGPTGFSVQVLAIGQ